MKGLLVGSWIFWPFRSLDFNTVVLKITNPVLAHETPVDDDDTFDAGVVNEFRTHHAGLARHDEPGVVGRYAVGCSVANQVHFGVMATDFHTRPGNDVHGVAKAFLSSAQASPSTRSSVVTVHQYYVALRVNQQGPEGAARAVGGFCQGQTLLDSNLQMLVLHTLTESHESALVFHSFATMASPSSVSALRAVSTFPWR